MDDQSWPCQEAEVKGVSLEALYVQRCDEASEHLDKREGPVITIDDPPPPKYE